MRIIDTEEVLLALRIFASPKTWIACGAFVFFTLILMGLWKVPNDSKIFSFQRNPAKKPKPVVVTKAVQKEEPKDDDEDSFNDKLDDDDDFVD